ncbi:hypothetical protein SAGCMC97051_07520 [Streptococcus agalactiae]|nr:hypothetical protein SAGCMC97051_07520 [Streptococcus agalactiae]
MVRVFRIINNPVFMRRTEKSVLLFVRLKTHKEGSLTMLEIVMDIDTLEVYEVIDHDQETSSDVTEETADSISHQQESQVTFYQMNLFDEMNLVNTS